MRVNFRTDIKIKNGDTVMISDCNPSHLGRGVSAYAGYSGLVTELHESGSFTINGSTSSLAVPKSVKLLVRDNAGSWLRVNHKVK